MERKIGDTFEFEGKTIRVEEDGNYSCHGCFFNNRCTLSVKKTAGQCEANCREDNKDVVFVKVQEQHTEEPKERKIGEVFEFEGKKLKVVKAEIRCGNCFFYKNSGCTRINRTTGECKSSKRSDNESVAFVEVKDEQPQKQAEQSLELNLCEVLKYCPKGETFWSPMFGDVKLYGIDQEAKKVLVTAVDDVNCNINADGTVTIYGITSPEIMLFPSREQRDWTKVKYEPKKELPKTWEEFCKQNPIREGECFIDDCCSIEEIGKDGGTREEMRDRNILPSREAAEAHLAYKQLHQLRDAWREGWVPDWKDSAQMKYAIYNLAGRFTIGLYTETRQFLAFQDKKRADEFLACFYDFIRQAGDLI